MVRKFFLDFPAKKEVLVGRCRITVGLTFKTSRRADMSKPDMSVRLGAPALPFILVLSCVSKKLGSVLRSTGWMTTGE